MHELIENVASMSLEDREIMSREFGRTPVENVAAMSLEDREIMSREFGRTPVRIDAASAVLGHLGAHGRRRSAN